MEKGENGAEGRGEREPKRDGDVPFFLSLFLVLLEILVQVCGSWPGSDSFIISYDLDAAKYSLMSNTYQIIGLALRTCDQ